MSTEEKKEVTGVPTYTLNTKAELPQAGMGLWQVPKDRCPSLIVDAVDAGWRAFDSASDYGNEKEVGEGIKQVLAAGKVKREELFITSKLWNSYHAAEHVKPACQRTLTDLGLDYLDLYLIHFPIATKFVPFETRYPPEWIFDPDAKEPKMEFSGVPMSETWTAMEKLVEEGLVKAIGLCNVTTGMLLDILTYTKIKPAMLQVESHPYLTQDKLIKFCKSRGIQVTAFSPFAGTNPCYGGASCLKDKVVMDIAEKIKKSAGQVLLRWAVQRGTVVIPKTNRKERMVENLSVFDFELSAEDMTAISGLNRNQRFNDPGNFCEEAFNTFCPIYD